MRTLDLSRRTMLGGLALAGAAPAVWAMQPRPPALVLHNGLIWTGDRRQPQARAVAILDGRVLALGDDREMLDLAGPATKRVDLGGKRVLPGFNDAHCHLGWGGISALRYVAADLGDVGAIVARLRERAARTPAGTAVIAYLYDDGKTPRPLDRADLDAVSTDHPVIVLHRGGHSSFVNSAALRAAGVAEDVADPSGGRFGRDANGRLNGLVVDGADAAFARLYPEAPTPDEMRRGVAEASRMFAAAGITSACDAGAGPPMFSAYQDARREGVLATRIYCHLRHPSLDRMIAAGVRTGLGDAMVRVGAVKLMADGSISERSALLSDPYAGRPDDHGLQVQTPEEMHDIALRAQRAGWQIGIHANGDVAVGQVLTVFERLQREAPRRDPRFRIEHCTIVDDALIRRIAAVGALPILFGGYVNFHGTVMHHYGEARLRHMFALRDLIDAGVPAASSSDYTASPANPMLWIQSEVTRTDPAGRTWGANQRVTVEEAIVSATRNGAFASFEEGDKGVLAPGMLADLAVWQRDPLSADPATIAEIRPERTMTGGRWVYES